jgi:hypothetical protein
MSSESKSSSDVKLDVEVGQEKKGAIDAHYDPKFVARTL